MIEKNVFRKELEALLNKHEKDTGTTTPDFLLANYLIGCMDVYDLTVRKRDNWLVSKGAAPSG